jgi:hypothetical protein
MAKSIINLTDNIATWVNKANTTVNRVGDLANLDSIISQDSSLVGAINSIDSDHRHLIDSNRTLINNKDSDLRVLIANNDSDVRYLIDSATTLINLRDSAVRVLIDSATSLVNLRDSAVRVLIANLDSDVGNRTSLLTNDKEDLVSAINEVKAQVNNLDSSTSGITGDLNNLLLRNPVGASGTLVDAINNLDSDLTSPFFDQRVRNLFAATGDLTYDSSTGQFGVTVNTETIQDAVGTAMIGGTQNGIVVTYNDAGDAFNFDVNDPTITISGDATGSGTMTNLANTTISVSLNANTVNSSELTSAVNLKIYNQAGSVVKNLYGSGS